VVSEYLEALDKGDFVTEPEWQASADPGEMLELLRRSGKLTGRKWRLFGIACCHRIRHLFTDERSRRAVVVAERYADGAATAGELDAAFEEAFDVGDSLAEQKDADPEAFLAMGLDPLRSAAWAASETAHPDESADGVASEAADAADRKVEREAQAELLRCIFGNPLRACSADAPWLTPTVVSLARSIYDGPAFDRLPLLADALEDAGCEDTGLLAHCRSDGPHIRGCWVVDLLLGKR
jgi:hypothetical protein